MVNDTLKPLEKNKKNTLPFIVVALLLVAVLAVVFILPKTVTKPAIAPTNSSEPSSSVKSQSPSPLELAEQRKARKASQDILESIIVVRDKLLERQVDTWASNAFNQSLSKVDSGEKLYARGAYSEALAAYQSAQSVMLELEGNIPERLNSALSEGRVSLSEFNQQTALEAFELATALDPDNDEAKRGLDRAKALPSTAPLWQQAVIHIDNEQWDEALSKLEKISEHDRNFPDLQTQIDIAKREVKEQNFTASMSEGFAALSINALEKAEQDFKAALKLKPNNKEALNALSQVKTAKIERAIASDMNEAKQLEQEENWAQAVKVYDALLKQYPSLIDIKASRLPASIRADIDKKYTELVRDPLEIGFAANYQAARQLLADMQSIDSRGPKLNRQIETLREMLIRSQTPVEITLVSDNATNVEVFRVGRFGTLTEKKIDLVPGRYTAAGNRQGYRDIQIAFTVDGLSSIDAIEVICTEPI